MMELQDPAQSLQRLQEQTGGEVVDGTVGTFTRMKEYSEQLSIEADEPTFVIHDYCIVRVPGKASLSTRQLVRKEYPDGREVWVSRYHARRFPRAWDAFMQGEDLKPEGTALEDCPDIPKTRIPILKSLSIKTVEELAHLHDRSLQAIGMDARVLQMAAKKWLEENNEMKRLSSVVGP